MLIKRCNISLFACIIIVDQQEFLPFWAGLRHIQTGVQLESDQAIIPPKIRKIFWHKKIFKNL